MSHDYTIASVSHDSPDASSIPRSMASHALPIMQSAGCSTFSTHSFDSVSLAGGVLAAAAIEVRDFGSAARASPSTATAEVEDSTPQISHHSDIESVAGLSEVDVYELWVALKRELRRSRFTPASIPPFVAADRDETEVRRSLLHPLTYDEAAEQPVIQSARCAHSYAKSCGVCRLTRRESSIRGVKTKSQPSVNVWLAALWNVPFRSIFNEILELLFHGTVWEREISKVNDAAYHDYEDRIALARAKILAKERMGRERRSTGLRGLSKLRNSLRHRMKDY